MPETPPAPDPSTIAWNKVQGYAEKLFQAVDELDEVTEMPTDPEFERLTADVMGSFTPGQVETLRDMEPEELRSFEVKLLRWAGLNWYRISRRMNLTIAETRRSAGAYPWPFDWKWLRE